MTRDSKTIMDRMNAEHPDKVLQELPPKPLMKHYQVEVEKNGCERCGCGKLWVIVNPEGIAGGTSYSCEDQAIELCDALNRAYEAGVASMEPIAASATLIAHYARRADEIIDAELSAKLIYEELEAGLAKSGVPALTGDSVHWASFGDSPLTSGIE